MRFISCLVVSVALAGCGDDGGEGVDAGRDAAGADGGDGGAPDAQRDDASGDGGDDGGGGDAGECTTWALIEVAATDMRLVDPSPVNTDRTARVVLTIDRGGCDDLAQPRVEVDPMTLTARVAARLWRRNGVDCPAISEQVVRPIALRLPAPGAWTVRDDAAGGSRTVPVVVAPGPMRACGATPCELDCDCDMAAGERCLSGSGLGGAFTQCALPCELDRDCGGDGSCQSPDDGLEFACSGGSECTDARPCRDGFGCAAGRCEPEFRLSATARVECACDADCMPGLSCVEPQTMGGARRCEARCLTGPHSTGVWCEGLHWCAGVAGDAAGLASSDAVCGFIGE